MGHEEGQVLLIMSPAFQKYENFTSAIILKVHLLVDFILGLANQALSCLLIEPPETNLKG